MNCRPGLKSIQDERGKAKYILICDIFETAMMSTRKPSEAASWDSLIIIHLSFNV